MVKLIWLLKRILITIINKFFSNAKCKNQLNFKTNELDQAVIYAQKLIIEFLKDQPHLIDEIEKAMSLLAQKTFSQCPLSHLTQNSQRIKVACEVNQQLFQDSQGNQQAKIRILNEILQRAQEILNFKLQYPSIIEISKEQFFKEQ
ncbi:unnamed protein product [Paramecium octaurelia]|uniref:CRA domain-containing protein n=1 Tax=Paramecium octaurelia TaxID=43137 RepID=A0A8S1SDT2_PAROT|nr:unnamed protein product [Paramecium octaurelia]